MADSEERFHKIAESIVEGNEELAKQLLKNEMYRVDVEEFYNAIMILLDSNLVINNKNKAIKYKDITKARSEFWLKSNSNEDILKNKLKFIKFQRDAIYNSLQKTRILLTPDNVEFSQKQETLKILALLPIMLDEIIENYLALFYSHIELTTSITFADSLAASARGEKPKKEKPEKQAVIDFATRQWEISSSRTLDDIAEMVRLQNITTKSFGTIKTWIAKYNPNRKNK
ncbi:hypothetical protein [Mannheimia pernigra]|uniref:hypothetical protein n=1 Tax=Mannheimia pernigra TaxID=111844 RepID=UPI001316F766|nr:hypothetical protein [Mannheimia pernigra]QHB17840.1 hypothetical protein GM695_07255 [Mannheimia pernigra]